MLFRRSAEKDDSSKFVKVALGQKHVSLKNISLYTWRPGEICHYFKELILIDLALLIVQVKKKQSNFIKLLVEFVGRAFFK